MSDLVCKSGNVRQLLLDNEFPTDSERDEPCLTPPTSTPIHPGPSTSAVISRFSSLGLRKMNSSDVEVASASDSEDGIFSIDDVLGQCDDDLYVVLTNFSTGCRDEYKPDDEYKRLSRAVQSPSTGAQPPSPSVQPSSPAAEPQLPPVQPLWLRLYPPERPRQVKSKFKVTGPGPRHTEGCSKPIDFFYLFMTNFVWNLMVQETNNYAQKHIDSLQATGRLRPSSQRLSWVNVTVEEIKKFWALLISMGLTKKMTVESYWSTQPSQFMPFFSKTMTLRRFQQILGMFHVSNHKSPNKSQPGYDPWVKVHDFIDHMNNAFRSHFVRSQEIYIEESRIGMKNHCAFIQYMANTRYARFGIKKFELCDCATGYVMQSALYSGKDFLEGASDPFTQKVVNDLMTTAGLYCKYYHLFTNNFYTEAPLAKFLLARKTFLTGIISKESRFISNLVKESNIPVGKSVYFRKNEVLIVKYRQHKKRKPVMLITTAYHAEDQVVVSHSGKRRIKPVVISGYDQHMGGVDSKDKTIFHLSSSCKTKRYWKKIVYNFVDMALLNAYILYRYHSQKPMRRWEFMNDIVDSLVSVAGPVPGPQCDTLLYQCPLPLPPNHTLQYLPGKNNVKCAVCEKKTTIWCAECKIAVHYECQDKFEHFLRPEQRRRRVARSPSSESD